MAAKKALCIHKGTDFHSVQELEAALSSLGTDDEDE